MKVHTLKQGDHFVFACNAEEENPYVYVVTEVFRSGTADCVCLQTGKDFSIGRDFEVLPVKVHLRVEVI